MKFIVKNIKEIDPLTMSRLKRTLLIILIIGVCVAADQYTKVLARNNLMGSPSVSYMYDTFRFQYAENKGAFLSFGSTFPKEVNFLVLTVLPTLLLICMLFYILFSKNLSSIETITFAFITGGGLSNIYDRIFNNGSVIDFMNTGIGSLRTGIFNVADLAITGGIITVVFWMFVKKPVEDS